MKKLPFLFVLFFSMAYLASCQNAGAHQPVDPPAPEAAAAVINTVLPAEAFREKLAATPEVQLLDVRTSREYQAGYIEGAVNIDFLQPAVFDAEIVKLDRNKPVMLYCRSGRRSAGAAKKMEALGFKEIYDLQGGYLVWEK